jgi:hypothetical protein
MQRRQEYNEAHGAPGCGYAPCAGHIPGLRPFTDRLRAVIWPRNFKLHDLDTNDGKVNPEDVMANYLPVVINQSANQWLLILREGSIDT